MPALRVLLLAIALCGTMAAGAQPPPADPASPSATADAAPSPSAAADPTAAPPAAFAGEIDVVGASPVHGAGDLDHAPGNVQTATDRDVAASRPRDLSELLSSRMGSVSVNDTEGNPFERDLQLRGFAASPVLGAAQGIAVYQDGVRLNEPFGDTVDWDLIPLSAISGIDLVPGSNPVFGLNAQGGALQIETKTGFTHPGVEATLEGGSFGERRVELAAGRRLGAASLFVAGDLDGEDGWREHSASAVRQLFADLGWAGARSSVDLSVTGARNRLNGDGATPAGLLAEDRRAIFTFPDVVDREALSVAGRFRLAPAPTTLVEGNLYARRLLTAETNGDTASYAPCAGPGEAGLLCSGEGEPVHDEHGLPVPLAGTLPDAARNGSRTVQNGYGGTLQATVTRPLAGRRNELLAGASADLGDALFDARSEIASLSPEREALGSGVFPLASFVRVESRSRALGAFAADTFFWTDRLAFEVAGRANAARVRLLDELGGDLSGDHSFRRLNPAASATYAPSPGRSLYATYAESSRAPNPVELACADPARGCLLPSAFVADPPLRQVVTRTAELGARARRGGMRASVALYRAVSSDDILFVHSGRALGQGYFANVGRTRRQGIEIGLRRDAPHPAGLGAPRGLAWYLAYSLTDATFETPFVAASPDNPFAENGAIAVRRGARLPGVPRHGFKAGLHLGAGRWSGGIEAVWSSPQYLRGDEANLAPPLAGTTLVAATGRLALGSRLALVGRIDNLLDRRVATFGTFGDASGLGAAGADPRFLVPGAPRALRLGIEVTR